METFFLIILILTMMLALSSGFPVAFALPGSAVLSILLAAVAGFYLLAIQVSTLHKMDLYNG